MSSCAYERVVKVPNERPYAKTWPRSRPLQQHAAFSCIITTFVGLTFHGWRCEASKRPLFFPKRDGKTTVTKTPVPGAICGERERAGVALWGEKKKKERVVPGAVLCTESKIGTNINVTLPLPLHMSVMLEATGAIVREDIYTQLRCHLKKQKRMSKLEGSQCFCHLLRDSPCIAQWGCACVRALLPVSLVVNGDYVHGDVVLLVRVQARDLHTHCGEHPPDRETK